MNIGDGLNVAQIVAKATELIAKDKHLARKAKNAGTKLSTAKSVKAITGAGALGGAVVGASGSSIMSTLAGAGAVVGSGVIAGIGMAAGAAGAGTAKLLNEYAFKDDKQAQVGSYSGAAVGTATSLGALFTVGAGPSGLASIGGVVGGGMAVGAISLLAVPAVAAGVVGGTLYWQNQKKKASLTKSSSRSPRSLGRWLRRRP